MTDYKEGGQGGSFYKKVNNMGNAQANNGSPDSANPEEKRKTILALLLALGILQTLYMNLAAFFPLFTHDHYQWIGGTEVGIVLA